MRIRLTFVVVVAVLSIGSQAKAGLYYSGEALAPLPSQWRGYLVDQRLLRTVANQPARGAAANPARAHYLEAAEKLEKAARDRVLTAAEQADLGALYVRLGDSAKAVAWLRAAQRTHPNHFEIAANLGTAWQAQGELVQAAAALELAVRLAPGKLQRAEEYHLKLVRLRQKAGGGGLDDLFGVRYVGEAGKFEPGKLAAAERKKLPADAAAIVQQLGLWLPADGPLVWQMAELASALGDVRTASAMREGCVAEFAMSDPELRRRRQLGRPAADARTDHEEHADGLAAHSKRPLLSRADKSDLPAIDAKGVNGLPWAVLSETTRDRNYKATFARYLKELDGKTVTLTGFMQPLGDDLEVTSFMFIEYPVGCWYCEMPEVTSILFVELPDGKTQPLTRGRVKVTGKLKLNAGDPENFLYTVGKAKVVEE